MKAGFGFAGAARGSHVGFTHPIDCLSHVFRFLAHENQRQHRGQCRETGDHPPRVPPVAGAQDEELQQLGGKSTADRARGIHDRQRHGPAAQEPARHRGLQRQRPAGADTATDQQSEGQVGTERRVHHRGHGAGAGDDHQAADDDGGARAEPIDHHRDRGPGRPDRMM